jgi:2-(1,2-epoxy-1,2-dihydrophenyl)acetyl-CoA isomerase
MRAVYGRTIKDLPEIEQMANSAATTDAVICERHGAVGLLRLNRPDKMNAFTLEISDGIAHHVPLLIADPTVRCLLITGSGKAFSAGGDISRMRTDLKGPEARDRMIQGQDRAKLLLACPKPIVVAVNGAAAGAGFAIAMLGDVIVAGQSAFFQSAFLGIAAVPDLGLGYTLTRAVGVPRAKDLMLTNRRINADEALAMGVVSRIFPDDQLQREALEIATRLSEGPSYSITLAKQLVGRSFDDTVETYFEREAYAQSVTFASEDFHAGVEAFKAKRKPKFSGR